MLKTCPICGQIFEPNDQRKKTCSAECAKRRIIEQKRKHYLKNRDYILARQRKHRQTAPKTIKTCPICGQIFETTYKKKLTCSAGCAKEFKRRYNRENCGKYNQLKEKAAPELKIKNCIACHKKFRQTFANEKFCSDACRADYFCLNGD